MVDNSALKDDALVADTWCHTRISEIHKCSYVWTIHNYMEYHYHSEQSIISTIFKSPTDDSCEWYLQLCPPSSKEIDLYLILLSSIKLGKNVLVKCEMSIMNDNRKRSNFHKQLRYNKLSEDTGKNGLHFFRVDSFFTANDISKKKILTDDKLTIFCKFQFFIESDTDRSFLKNVVAKSVSAEDNDIDCTLIKDFENLYLNGTLSDFVISVDGRDHLVHKNVLAARSKVFAAMFQQNMKEQKENRLEITDLRENVVNEMLRYIYTGQVKDWETTAFELLQAADKYDLQHLKNMCQYAIIKKLSVGNVVNCLILADVYRAPLLEDQAIQFLKIRSEEVMKTASWSKLEESRIFSDIFFKLCI